MVGVAYRMARLREVRTFLPPSIQNVLTMTNCYLGIMQKVNILAERQKRPRTETVDAFELAKRREFHFADHLCEAPSFSKSERGRAPPYFLQR